MREVSRTFADVFPESMAVSQALSEGLFGVQTREDDLLKCSLSPRKRDNVSLMVSSET
jgi:hypothetical protein